MMIYQVMFEGCPWIEVKEGVYDKPSQLMRAGSDLKIVGKRMLEVIETVKLPEKEDANA